MSSDLWPLVEGNLGQGLWKGLCVCGTVLRILTSLPMTLTDVRWPQVAQDPESQTLS